MKTQIKICGLTNYADARLALELGADFLGFVLYSKSPRAVSPQQTAAIVTALRRDYPHSQTKMVGVVVDEIEPEAVRMKAHVDLIQFHGDESIDAVRALSRARAIKAFRLRDCYVLTQLATYVPYVSHILIDAFSETGTRGGTGETANWNLAREASQLAPTFLAGGLHAENVGEAIRIVKPWGIDASSRLEKSPGQKDEHKLRDFFAAARKDSSKLYQQGPL